MVKFRVYFFGGLLVFMIVGVMSCRNLGTWLAKSDIPEHADVMVMLMGGITDRSVQTADLYKENKAGRVWIVEAGMDDDRAQVLKRRGIEELRSSSEARFALQGLGIPKDSILILPGAANSTRMEAEIVRDYLLTQNGVDTLLLVSSSFHTRRAYKIFKSALHPLDDTPVLYCSPSKYTRFDAEKWWTHKREIYMVGLETMKLANYYLVERRQLRRGDR